VLVGGASGILPDGLSGVKRIGNSDEVGKLVNGRRVDVDFGASGVGCAEISCEKLGVVTSK
jgi:hypothetical protein